MGRLVVLLSAVSLLGCSSSDEQASYYQHIAPVIQSKCARCHTDGGIAPFALEDIEDARTHAGVSLLAIEEQIMPPWLADGDCNEYWGDYSLTDEEIDLWRSWVAGGMPAGDASAPVAPPEIEDLTLSRVDLQLGMATEYTPVASPDDYRCFLVDWPAEYTEDMYVTGFRAVPGNLKNVHHVIAFLGGPSQRMEYEAKDLAEEGPGYTCFGGTGGSANAWVGGWAPGNNGSDMPEGSGIRVEPGSFIILQVHYNTLTALPEPDQSMIELSVTDTVEREATVQPWANPFWLQEGGMQIPANEPEVTHGFAFDPTPFLSDGEPMVIHGAALHMHELGQAGKLRILRANGDEECLLDIPRWDFDWQGGYALREPTVLMPGDRLDVECTWSNMPEDQPIVDGRPLPPKDVEWGEGTQDEMCLGFVTWTPQ